MIQCPTWSLSIAIVILLLLAGPAAAWHWEDEAPNEKFESQAGDPRVLEDGAACFEALNATSEVGQDEHCLVLYAHHLDMLSRGYLNTQRPADCAPDLARGFTMSPHVEPLWSFHRKVLAPQSGFIEYNEDCMGDARLTGTGDFSEPLRLSATTDIIGYWYLSADALEVSNADVLGDGPSTGVMPCVTVRMVLETGRSPGAGTVIAEGQTTKTILTTPDGQSLPVDLDDPCPGAMGQISGTEVTGFEVNLGSSAAVLSNDGFHVEVQWYQHDGGDPDEANNAVQNDWNMRTGADHPNRIVMPVRQTHHVDRLGTTTNADGTITVNAKISSVLGSYDVDEENLRLWVTGPHGDNVPLEHVQGPIIDDSLRVVYGGHLWPVEAQFIIDPAKEEVDLTGHSVRLLATNWQHTTIARHAAITDGPLEVEDSPLPLIVVLLALTAVGILARRVR